MPKGGGTAESRTATMCPCGELGWPKKQAFAERGRIARTVRRRPGRGPAVLARSCDHEDSELFHVRIVPVDGPLPIPPQLTLALPARPYEPVPAPETFVMVTYRTEVAAALALAIEQQGADRLLPGTRKLAEHYSMGRVDVLAVRGELLARQLIRRDGERYVTSSRPSSASTTSEVQR